MSDRDLFRWTIALDNMRQIISMRSDILSWSSIEHAQAFCLNEKRGMMRAIPLSLIYLIITMSCSYKRRTNWKVTWSIFRLIKIWLEIAKKKKKKFQHLLFRWNHRHCPRTNFSWSIFSYSKNVLYVYVCASNDHYCILTNNERQKGNNDNENRPVYNYSLTVRRYKMKPIVSINRCTIGKE